MNSAEFNQFPGWTPPQLFMTDDGEAPKSGSLQVALDEARMLEESSVDLFQPVQEEERVQEQAKVTFSPKDMRDGMEDGVARLEDLGPLPKDLVPQAERKGSVKSLALAIVVGLALVGVGFAAYYNFEAIKHFAQTQASNAQHLISGGGADAATKPIGLIPVANTPVYTEQFGLVNGVWGMHPVKVG